MAGLVRALANGKVTLGNTTRSEVILYYPGSAKTESRVFGPKEVIEITKEITVDQLRRSPNLASLTDTQKLRVEQ